MLGKSQLTHNLLPNNTPSVKKNKGEILFSFKPAGNLPWNSVGPKKVHDQVNG